MEKKLNYFDMAENDYQFLEDDYARGRYGNVMCYCAQNVCERYLKHIIDLYVREVDTSVVLKTHNLNVLQNFIKNNIKEFNADWLAIKAVNGYYYEARYPGVDALITDRDDTDVCWNGVNATRDAVIKYLDEHPIKNSMDTESLKKISTFE